MANAALDAFVAARLDAADADILAAWRADPTTARPVPLDALEAYLNSQGLRRKLEEVRDAAGTPPAVKGGLADFLVHLSSSRQRNLGTDDDLTGTATRAAQLLGYLQQTGHMTPQQAAAILALGGGRRHDPAVTEADVAAARVVVVARAGTQAAHDDWSAEYNAGYQEINRRDAAGEPQLSRAQMRAFVAAARPAEG